MIIEVPIDKLLYLIVKQVDNFFLINKNEIACLKKAIGNTLKRCERCFINNKNKYYSKNSQAYFNPYHSGQYTIFLYYLSNELYKGGCKLLADKLYYLNRALNSCDLFYEVELPEVFMIDHPLGSVMGRAVYGNFFTFLQQCTVGNNKGDYPVIGDYVTMYSGSKILGKCNIGNNVILAANSYIKDMDIPSNSIVFGTYPSITIKERI